MWLSGIVVYVDFKIAMKIGQKDLGFIDSRCVNKHYSKN